MLRQFDATQILVSPRSWAKAKASRQAMASRVAGLKPPEIVRDEAPKYKSVSSLQTTTMTPSEPIFDVAESTFIFARPGGGACHLVGVQL
jgi:hypothetical protein